MKGACAACSFDVRLLHKGAHHIQMPAPNMKPVYAMQNDLEFLRIRSMKQEVMVAPRKRPWSLLLPCT